MNSMIMDVKGERPRNFWKKFETFVRCGNYDVKAENVMKVLSKLFKLSEEAQKQIKNELDSLPPYKRVLPLILAKVVLKYEPNIQKIDVCSKLNVLTNSIRL